MRKSLHFLIYPLLLLLPLFFFNKIITGNVILAGDFSGSDLLDLHFPFRFALHKAITGGFLPLWEKNLSLGFPLFAEGQTGSLFPLNLLFSFLEPATGLNLSILSVFSVSLFGTFFYLRLLKKGIFESLFAAIVFSFSAFFITRIKHINLISTASVFPYLLIFTKLYFDRKRNLYIILAGITISLMMLAGHPQVAFYNLFIFALYASFEMFRSFKQKSDVTAIPRGIVLLTSSIILGLALSAVQILPTLELSSLSSRVSFTRESLIAYPFHPKNLITFISPYYYGNPATASYSQDIRTSGIFWENASYIGMAPFLLALIAIFLIIRKRNRSIYDKFFLALLLFTGLLMLGPFTPIFPALIENLPIFNLFRFPTRFNLYLIFSLSVLSSSGLSYTTGKIDNLKSRINLRKPQTDSEEFRFNWPLNKNQTSTLIIAFTLLDLFVFAKAYIGYIPKNELLNMPEYAKMLKEESIYFRTYNTTQYMDSPYRALGWIDKAEPITDSRKTMPPNNNIMFDIPSFTDRGWFEGGLSIARRNAIERFILYENTDPVNTGKLLGMYSVKYILSFSDELGIEIYKEDEIDLGEIFNIPLKLFRNDLVIPRVYVVPEAKYHENASDLFEEMKSSDFLPTKTVLLEDKPRTTPKEFEGALTEFQKDNTAEIVKNEASEVEIKAKIKTHSFLVLNDIFYPGWKVKINGKDGKILRANYIVRGLELDPGEHEIKFYYDPLPFKVGAIISSLTLFMVFVIFVIAAGKKFLKTRKKHSQSIKPA